MTTLSKASMASAMVLVRAPDVPLAPGGIDRMTGWNFSHAGPIVLICSGVSLSAVSRLVLSARYNRPTGVGLGSRVAGGKFDGSAGRALKLPLNGSPSILVIAF